MARLGISCSGWSATRLLCGLPLCDRLRRRLHDAHQPDAAPSLPLAEALAINLALLTALRRVLLLSGMARPAFKKWWTRIIPASAERSMYVLLSSPWR